MKNEIVSAARGEAGSILPTEAENAWIRRAAVGDRGAQERLLAQYEGLIVKESRQPYLRAALAADAPSIAQLAFLEAIRDFDASRGVHFAAFAASRIHAALYNAFRRARKLWERETHPDQNADAGSFWERYSGAADRADAEDERTCRRIVLQQAIATLSEREKKILRLLYFEDMKVTALAELLHVTHQAVSFAKKKILRKLRIFMEGGKAAPAY